MNPKVIKWARERAGYSLEEMQKRFPKIRAWETGRSKPDIDELERYAKATFIPFGLLFALKPPSYDIPLTDLRENKVKPKRPLLKAIYEALTEMGKHKQSWPLSFVNSALSSYPPVDVIAKTKRDVFYHLSMKERLPELGVIVKEADFGQATAFSLCSDMEAIIVVKRSLSCNNKDFLIGFGFASLLLGRSILTDAVLEKKPKARIAKWCYEVAEGLCSN